MKLTKIKDMIIYKDTEYSSFPTVVKLPSGKLVTSFRHARNMTATLGKTTHIDPASKGVLVTSDDQGESWSQQFTVIYDDFYLGIQDPCINLLQDGTLFCTFFSWKVLPASGP